jgi:hypothetical protein
MAVVVSNNFFLEEREREKREKALYVTLPSALLPLSLGNLKEGISSCLFLNIYLSFNFRL